LNTYTSLIIFVVQNGLEVARSVSGRRTLVRTAQQSAMNRRLVRVVAARRRLSRQTESLVHSLQDEQKCAISLAFRAAMAHTVETFSSGISESFCGMVKVPRRLTASLLLGARLRQSSGQAHVALHASLRFEQPHMELHLLLHLQCETAVNWERLIGTSLAGVSWLLSSSTSFSNSVLSLGSSDELTMPRRCTGRLSRLLRVCN
jgi:hypothetical protein